MVYSATDADYRANHLEEDLKAYYAVLSGYMDEKVDYKLFREEVEERRVKGMTMDGKCLENNLVLRMYFPQPLPAWSPSARRSYQVL